MRVRTGLALLGIAVLGGALLAHSQPAQAIPATRTWTGGDVANSNWSDADNWDTGAPVAGDLLVFPQAAARKTNTNDLAPNTLFDSITFDGSGYSISGNDVAVATLVLNRPGSGSNSLVLDVGGAGGITNESGRLVLDGNNTFSGPVNVTGGTVTVTSDTGLGTSAAGTFVAEGATLALSGGIDIGNELVEFAGEGVGELGALQSLGGTNRAGNIRLMDDATVGVVNSTFLVGSLSEGSPGGGLMLIGGGKLQVENSTFTGPVDVIESNLTWNASSQAFVEVDKFGWLRGTGTVASAHIVGGLLWPGSGNAPGILTVMGLTTFSGGTLKVDLDGPTAGAGYGQLATGGVSLTSNATLLDIDRGYTPVIGQVFTIINNFGGAVDGTFFNLPEGATFTADGYVFRISYKGGDGNDVTLTVLRAVTADLKLTMTASPSPVAAGNLLAYTVTLTNLGPDAASSPRVTMGTPVGTTFESATGPANWTCSKPTTSPSISCIGPGLGPGATATFTFVFRANSGLTGTITGTAGVSSDTNDPFSGNNAATLVTPVGGPGSLGFRLVIPGVARD